MEGRSKAPGQVIAWSNMAREASGEGGYLIDERAILRGFKASGSV